MKRSTLVLSLIACLSIMVIVPLVAEAAPPVTFENARIIAVTYNESEGIWPTTVTVRLSPEDAELYGSEVEMYVVEPEEIQTLTLALASASRFNKRRISTTIVATMGPWILRSFSIGLPQ